MEMDKNGIEGNTNRQILTEQANEAAAQALNEAYNFPYFTNTVDGFDEQSTLFTHMQVHDSYREGTVDNHIEDSKNDVDTIARKGYNM